MGAPAPTTSPLVRRYRLDEFFALEPPPGGGHYELIGGVLYMVPPPKTPHDLAAAQLVRLLSRYQDAHADRCTLLVPRAAVWTPADTYLEPDMMLVTAERLAATGDGPRTAADLVVEIHSPSTAVYDRTTKADTYAALGVRELWLVDLEREVIEQRVLVAGRWEGRGTFAGEAAVECTVFPGLRVTAADVFAHESR